MDNVTAWNTHNKLLCNPSKTEVFQFSSRFARNPIIGELLLGDTTVHLVDRVRNLGVIMDKELNLSHHITSVCKRATLSLQSIALLRKYLSSFYLKMSINAFIVSYFDYCHSLYCGLPECVINKLQCIQNSAACLILGLTGSDCITPVSGG